MSWVSRYVNDEGEDETDDRTDVFARTADGWDDRGSGGAAGPSSDDPHPLRRWVSDPRAVLLSCSGGSGNLVQFTGLAGAEAVRIEVTDSDGTLTRPIESPIGRIVVAANGAALVTVRVLDADGAELRVVRYRPERPLP